MGKLNIIFDENSLEEKEKYHYNIVEDVKLSNTGQWYSKINECLK